MPTPSQTDSSMSTDCVQAGGWRWEGGEQDRPSLVLSESTPGSGSPSGRVQRLGLDMELWPQGPGAAQEEGRGLDLGPFFLSGRA